MGPESVTGCADADRQLRAAVRSCDAAFGGGFVYGGLTCGDGVRLSSFVGARTHGLHDLLVRSEAGLGGKVLRTRRPETVLDYAGDSGITHDYDGPVLAEGIRSVAAVPVVLEHRTRGLLYAATRTDAPIGTRVVDVMVGLARRLADRLRTGDEVDARVRTISALTAAPAPTEDVRDVYRELRAIAQLVEDPGLQTRLLQATQRLVGTTADARVPDAPLSRREIDVLAEAAMGCTNHDIADRLALTTETVKAYLKSASNKLGTTNRWQAVSEARRRGLLP